MFIWSTIAVPTNYYANQVAQQTNKLYTMIFHHITATNPQIAHTQ